MRIDRRSFIQSAAFVATTQAFPPLLPLPSTMELSLVRAESPSARDATDATCIVFKIDGWDDRATRSVSENEVLIRINQSWRTAWR
jgi:hypothetical protein